MGISLFLKSASSASADIPVNRKTLLGSVSVIIIYKEKDKTDDLRKLSTQNIITIRSLLCKFVQACKLV